MRIVPHRVFLALALILVAGFLRADDGYRLWLRYDRLPDEQLRTTHADRLSQIDLITLTGTDSPTIAAAKRELATGLGGLLGRNVAVTLATRSSAQLTVEDGFAFDSKILADGSLRVAIRSATDIGILYGVFDLLRRIQTGQPIDKLSVTSAPKIQRRLLNHWDNLDRKVERGYAGFSIWEWFYLPDYVNPRYRDYARACASLGINGTVLNNVNAQAEILKPEYLERVAAIADELRPYGIRVYVSARFSAPKDIGGLKTTDPLDPAVIAWWKAKIDEIYRYVPDFGGFLVKANSEGEPGPQDYGRTHADGANMLADAFAPHGGIVMWRAFVYSADNKEDRVKQAYSEFMPLDGKFRDNVVVQIKNGPLDFMPREPFSPLFGSLARTNLAAELQITQEYIGQSTQLAFLAPMWTEFLNSDTYAKGPTRGEPVESHSTVARVINGSLRGQHLTVIAGVANIGTDRNWTGHPLAQANWYAYGRLAWDQSLTAAQIADEWTKLTFGTDPRVVQPITKMLLGSRETVVNYSMPLGLHHIMAEGNHYGPGPWVDKLKRADWTSVYYHRADAKGLGVDRTASGSNALEQYAPELRALWGNLDTCPENLLLWFHHVPWDHKMKSGRTLWDELCLRYQQGVDEVRAMQRDWDSLPPSFDAEQHAHVKALLKRQEKDAIDWRDACLLYFGQFSKRPLPAGVEPPAHELAYYESIRRIYMPGHK